jgi:integrase
LTRISYAEHIHRYLTPHLGPLVLEELTPARVREAFEQISQHTVPSGDLLSAATVQRVRATLRAALNSAVRERLLPSNPPQGLRLESGRGARPVVWTEQALSEWQYSGVRPAVAVWTVEQTRHFLDFVSEDRLYGLFHLLVMTGLRRGEVVALRWPDIDLIAGTVRVERQMQAHRGGLVELAPKSAASRRMLTLDHATTGVLRRHQWHQQKEAESQGRVWDPRGFVFTAVRGGPLAPQRLSRLFRKLNTESGLPPVRLHDLRHGAATLELAAGVELKGGAGDAGAREHRAHRGYLFQCVAAGRAGGGGADGVVGVARFRQVALAGEGTKGEGGAGPILVLPWTISAAAPRR